MSLNIWGSFLYFSLQCTLFKKSGQQGSLPCNVQKVVFCPLQKDAVGRRVQTTMILEIWSHLNSAVRLLKVIYPACRCCNPVQCPLIWHLSYSKLYLALPNNNLAHMILLAQQRRWPGRTTPNGEVMESPSTIPSWKALQTRPRQCLNWLRLFREWCAVLGGAVSANGYLTSTYTKANFLGIYFLFRGLLSHIARAVYLKRTISFLCSLAIHGTVGGWDGPWKAVWFWYLVPWLDFDIDI